MNHFNIAKNEVVNPFEGITQFVVSPNTTGEEVLRPILRQVTKSKVRAIRVQGDWTIAYSLSVLDFTVLISWHSASTGKFKIGNKTVYFCISQESKTMICW